MGLPISESQWNAVLRNSKTKNVSDIKLSSWKQFIGLTWPREQWVKCIRQIYAGMFVVQRGHSCTCYGIILLLNNSGRILLMISILNTEMSNCVSTWSGVSLAFLVAKRTILINWKKCKKNCPLAEWLYGQFCNRLPCLSIHWRGLVSCKAPWTSWEWYQQSKNPVETRWVKCVVQNVMQLLLLGHLQSLLCTTVANREHYSWAFT